VEDDRENIQEGDKIILIIEDDTILQSIIEICSFTEL
jgi:hypothetical protein